VPGLPSRTAEQNERVDGKGCARMCVCVCDRVEDVNCEGEKVDECDAREKEHARRITCKF